MWWESFALVRAQLKTTTRTPSLLYMPTLISSDYSYVVIVLIALFHFLGFLDQPCPLFALAGKSLFGFFGLLF